MYAIRSYYAKTGETVCVKDHAVVAFRAGKDLKNNVWDIPEKREVGELNR